MNDYGLKAIESGELLALRGVDVVARISGLLAKTTLTQKYGNDTKTNLELAYTFPLPVAGILMSFSVRIGERRLEGEVIARKDAEAAYEEAISAGNSAFRLQEIRPGMYSATLGNVLAGEAVEIKLSYAETLAWNGSSIRYRLPTTIAPRYGEPKGMQPWQRPVASLTPEYPLSLVITIAGALAHGSVSCPSHKVSLKAGESLQITLAAGATLDRDFVLEIQNEQVQSLGVVATARDTHAAMLTLLPPEVDNSCGGRDTVLVIDCSGSMQGDSLKLANEGVLLALGSLQPKERFAVIEFGTHFMKFDDQLQPANRKNLDMARRWVNCLRNLGGTDLKGALDLALGYHDGEPMDILLLTDGEVWDTGEAIAKANEIGVRIFSIGIGSAVAEDTVRTLADRTGGACELVAPTEDMSERVYRHFMRMRQSRMVSLAIEWPGNPLWEVRPSTGCFAGDASTIVAAFAQPVTSPVTVTYEFSGNEPVTQIVPMVDAGEISDSIVRVAARRRLDMLDMDEQQAWAVRYQLITEQTDYLITAERSAGERPADLPGLQVVPQMLAAGWGGPSTVLNNINCCGSMTTNGPTALSSLKGIDYCHFDVPAVVRKSCASKIMDKPRNGYDGFIKKLTDRSSRKLFGGLPTTKNGLKDIPLPDEIESLLDELVAQRFAENEIIRAFYLAILKHDGKKYLSRKFVQKAEAIIGKLAIDSELVNRFLKILNKLWNARGVGLNSGIDRYDIPAFLRKRAD